MNISKELKRIAKEIESDGGIWPRREHYDWMYSLEDVEKMVNPDEIEEKFTTALDAAGIKCGEIKRYVWRWPTHEQIHIGNDVEDGDIDGYGVDVVFHFPSCPVKGIRFEFHFGLPKYKPYVRNVIGDFNFIGSTTPLGGESFDLTGNLQKDTKSFGKLVDNIIEKICNRLQRSGLHD